MSVHFASCRWRNSADAEDGCCGAEPPCLFGRKSVHKSGCFRVSSVKYDNRCEKDGGLSVGEAKSWLRREKEREGGRGGQDGLTLVRALTHCAATKVESNVFFVQPFPRERLSTCPCRILSSFSEKVCGLLVQRINSTSERVNTLDKYVLCVASFPRTFRDAFFFYLFYLSSSES